MSRYRNPADVALASGCATFDTARHLVGAAPQPREALTLEQLEAAERDVSKAQLAVEDAMMELAIAERHVAEKKHELAAARRVITPTEASSPRWNASPRTRST